VDRNFLTKVFFCLRSYIEELLALQHMLFYIQDALIALFLWRGTLPVRVFGKEFFLPIHSVTAFVVVVVVAEKPDWFPSFFLFGIAWLMLASMDYRRRCPDIWTRCKSYSELARALLLGESKTPPDDIEPYQNYDKAQQFLEFWKKRIADAEDKATKEFEEASKMQDEQAKRMYEVDAGTVDIVTKRSGISVDPFKPILFPVQQNLAMACRYVRHVKYILLWDEAYLSFWVTTGCLLLGTISLFVPWCFLMKWTARAVAWTFFGPWMKLVDIFYISKIEPLTEEEIERRNEKDRERRNIRTSAAEREARIKRENMIKLKTFKKEMFGKYVNQIPVLKEDRYPDIPLPESMAVPHRPELQPLSGTYFTWPSSNLYTSSIFLMSC